jgi:hypothetical protein
LTTKKIIEFKEKIKDLFSQDNIALTLIFGVFLGSIVYAIFTQMPFMAIVMMGVIGVSCYLWGYLRGEEHQKEKQERDEYEKNRKSD